MAHGRKVCGFPQGQSQVAALRKGKPRSRLYVCLTQGCNVALGTNGHGQESCVAPGPSDHPPRLRGPIGYDRIAIDRMSLVIS
jgi:hypothetical protein